MSRSIPTNLDVAAARYQLLLNALYRLAGEDGPSARATLFVVPEEIEYGTEHYEALANQKVETRWQLRALDRLVEAGLLRKEQPSHNKVLYDFANETDMRTIDGWDKVVLWAVTGTGSPTMPMLAKPEAVRPVDTTPEVAEPPSPEEPSEEDESFEMLVAQKLKAISQRIRKLEDRFVHAQQTLDNLQSTTRKLESALSTIIEHKDQAGIVSEALVESVKSIHDSAAVILEAAKAANTHALYTVAVRMQAMNEENKALQEIVLEHLEKRS